MINSIGNIGNRLGIIRGWKSHWYRGVHNDKPIEDKIIKDVSLSEDNISPVLVSIKNNRELNYIKLKPITPGQRFRVVSDFDTVTTSKPEKSLLTPLKIIAGRRSLGRIIIYRNIDDEHRKKYRIIDFNKRYKRYKCNIPTTECAQNRILNYVYGRTKYKLNELEKQEKRLFHSLDLGNSFSPLVLKDFFLNAYCIEKPFSIQKANSSYYYNASFKRSYILEDFSTPILEFIVAKEPFDCKRKEKKRNTFSIKKHLTSNVFVNLTNRVVLFLSALKYNFIYKKRRTYCVKNNFYYKKDNNTFPEKKNNISLVNSEYSKKMDIIFIIKVLQSAIKKHYLNNRNGNNTDTIGNHSSETKTEPFVVNGLGNDNINYTYNNNLQIENGANNVSFDYDTNRNTTSKTAQYQHDVRDNRRKNVIVVGTEKRYVLGVNKVLIKTNNTNTAQNYYIYGLVLISRIDARNNTNYYHYNFRGSPIAMTNSTENLAFQYEYNDFGQTIQGTESDFNAYHYVGKYDVTYKDTELYFMRARYYDSSIGRFLSEDLIWSTNLYSYVNNNPHYFLFNSKELNGCPSTSDDNFFKRDDDCPELIEYNYSILLRSNIIESDSSKNVYLYSFKNYTHIDDSNYLHIIEFSSTKTNNNIYTNKLFSKNRSEVYNNL